MKIIKFLFLSILSCVFLSCITHRHIWTYENTPEDVIYIRIFSDDNPLLLVRIKNPYYGNCINNIEYING